MPTEAALLPRDVDVLVVHNDEHLRQFLDVMVLDIDARGMDCFEFLAEIRADAAIPFFPVIYLTADMNAAGCAHELGAACVQKPIQPEALLAAVASSTFTQHPHPPAPQPAFVLAAVN